MKQSLFYFFNFFNVTNSTVSSHKAVIDDFTNNLNFGTIILQFINLIILCAVNVSAWKRIYQIHILINPQFFTLQIAPIGTNAFEVFDGSE